MKIRTIIHTLVCPATLLFVAVVVSSQTLVDSDSPVVKSLPKPIYPVAAKSAGIGGDVFVVLLVDKKGNAKVVDSYGPMAPCTDLKDARAASVRAAGVAAAESGIFSPAIFKGKAVDKGLEIRFIFDPFEGKDRPDDIGTVQSLPKENWPVAVRIPKAKYHRGGGKVMGDIRVLGTKVGPVRVKILIDENGRVLQVGPMSGSQREHRETAVDAACQSEFRPATRNGKPIKFELIFEHNFYDDIERK
jgi:Gram-negative bacterial TonB protein C-terminal